MEIVQMSITSILRDWADGVSIVRILSTDSLATVGTAGYLTAQSANIAALNSGAFEWATSDMVLVYASNGWGFFTVSPDFASLTAFVFSTSVTGATVVGDFAQFDSTNGNLVDNGVLPSDASKTRVVMAGSAVQVGYLAHFVDTTGTVDDTPAAVINAGTIQSGLNGTVGGFIAYPAAATSGTLRLIPVTNSSGNFNTTISNAAAIAQTQIISIPDSGSATANFILDKGNNVALSVLNLKYGATPVAQVDPGSCTIVAAAGAANTATVTVQLKDGSGTNLTYSVPFTVYASSAANGLTLASAASTGFSVASGGLSLANGTAVTTKISAISSATGGCVLSLLDTAKQTSYLVLVLENGVKISAQLSAGSYG